MGSTEPVSTSSNPAATSPVVQGVAAQPDAALQVVDAQPVSPTLIPQCDGLSAQQRVAIASLASGQSISSSAQSAGVSGATIYRWRTKDPAFIAALNAWRNQANTAVRDRLLAMADQAAMTIFGAMRKGDAKTAMTLLKGLGAIAPTPQGPTAVPAVRQDLDREECKQTVAARSRWVDTHSADYEYKRANSGWSADFEKAGDTPREGEGTGSSE
ncbi:MAG TPA: hypothetical protein VG269_24760 [Tepidisphaeraceae bacterium]|nr:hypothetical protein [Tepidisphaeraceae bacterium]